MTTTKVTKKIRRPSRKPVAPKPRITGKTVRNMKRAQVALKKPDSATLEYLNTLRNFRRQLKQPGVVSNVYTKVKAAFKSDNQQFITVLRDEGMLASGKIRLASVELECFFLSNEDENQACRFMEQQKLTVISNDPSVTECASGASGYEFKVTSIVGRWERLKQIASFIEGAATTDASCGMHVHLSVGHLTEERQRIAGKRLYNNLRHWLYQCVPLSRFNSSYCCPSNNHDRYGRYCAINMEAIHCHSTIEMRFPPGFSCANDIVGWPMVGSFLLDSPRSYRDWQDFLTHADGKLEPWVIAWLSQLRAANQGTWLNADGSRNSICPNFKPLS